MQGTVKRCWLELAGMSIPSAVLHVFRNRNDQSEIASLFLQEVGSAMQNSLQDQPFTEDALQCLTSERRSKVSRAVRKSLGELPLKITRNAFRATKLMKRLGFSSAMHEIWVDVAYMRRYSVAMRYWFDNKFSFHQQ